MTLTILLLRGINLGGRNRLAMADLRTLAQRCGADRAETYLQSVNLVVDGCVAADALPDAISGSCGFHPLVIARSLDHWRRLVAGNPLSEVDDPKALDVFSLSAPSATTAPDLLASAGPAERVHVTPTQVWLHTPEYLSGSLIGERMDRLMRVPATARNWHSVSGIHALAEKLAG